MLVGSSRTWASRAPMSTAGTVSWLATWCNCLPGTTAPALTQFSPDAAGAEHDAMEWCKGRLQAVFQGTDILAGSSSGDSLTITEVVCKGEAIINNRKQKLIPAYELDITLRFKGQAGGPDAPVAGRVLLPYVADENHDENPEVRFSSESDDAAAQRLKAAFAATGQKVGARGWGRGVGS